MAKKIVINGYFLSKPFTGINQYTRNLIETMSMIDTINEYHIVVPEPINLKLPSNWIIHAALLPPVPTMSLKKLLWEQITIPSLCRSIGADLYHCVYAANPHRFFSKTPCIVTVHDVIPWTNKAYTQKIRSKIYQYISWHNLKYAKKIISVSKTTKKALEDLGIHKEKISVIYNTIASLGKAKKYPVKKPYFLYVGGYDERKNVVRMCESFAKAHSKNYNLIMIGKPHDNSPLYQSFKQARHKNIQWTGPISDEERNYLYAHANAFINCSLEEGFNLPLIEAAVSNVPIIASNIPVHHEVIEKGALYCNPKSEKSIISAIQTMIDISASDAKKLTQKANDAIQKFKPQHEGKKLFKIYQEVMDL